MSELMLKCKSCGKDFGTSRDVDEATFATMTIEDNLHQCTNCGKENLYSTPDFFFR